MRYAAPLVFVFTLVGCASTSQVMYNIDSQPTHAPVDVNGVTIGTTPATAALECDKRWVGVLNAPGGWANASGKYEITAYPPKGFNGQSQTKNVDPCEWKGQGNPTIHFDLGLEKVGPVQKIEIVTPNSRDGSNVQKSLEALKALRNAGVLTEQEYKNKVMELVR